MNVRVLVVFVLVVVVPIAIGLYWIVANGTGITLFGFTAFLLIAAAVFSVLRAIASAQKRRRKEHFQKEWEQDIVEFQENLKGRIAGCSVACGKCGSSACPILNSQNRYRCSKCGQDFAGAEHGLIDLDEFTRRNPVPSNVPYPTAKVTGSF